MDSGNAEEPQTSEEAGPSGDAQVPGNADTGQAVATHTGESHDDPGSSEAVRNAASPGGPVSTATETATANEAAQEWAERKEAEAERAIEARDEPAVAAAHARAAAGPSAALIESTQIRRAITIAEKRTELKWSVFVGTLGDEPRAQAEARHAELGPAAAKSVLIAVDPVARRLEIVTGSDARAVLDDRSCALAAASMASTFAVRDLDGGIAYGILAMVEHVRRAR